MMPSPVNLSTVPSKRVTPAERIFRKRSMIARHSSGSSAPARSIDPCTSANRTVTCLRSPASSEPPWRTFSVRSWGSGSEAEIRAAPPRAARSAPCSASALPQAVQKSCSNEARALHTGHASTWESGSPQPPQKRAPGGFDLPQRPHVLAWGWRSEPTLIVSIMPYRAPARHLRSRSIARAAGRIVVV